MSEDTIKDVEDAVDEALRSDLDENEHPIAWALVAAIHRDDEKTNYVVYSPKGQPGFMSLGLLHIAVREEEADLDADDETE